MFELEDVLRRLYGYLRGRPMSFSFIDDYVCGSARPMSAREVAWLKTSKGVKSILSLTESPLPEAWLNGIRYYHVPIQNHASPSMDQLSDCVNFLISQSSSQTKVDVHCAAGQGRTGTVLAAYLCAIRGEDPKSAIGKIRTLRRGSIENSQESAIYEFYDAVVKKTK